MKNLIRKIIKEETENNKVNSVVDLIKTLFGDVVVDIEVSELYGKPYINVDIKTDDPAANIETWYTHQIKDTVLEYTGGGFVLQPFWSADRLRGKNADAFIDVNKSLYDDEGNHIKESFIKKHPREEELESYSDLIDDIIYRAVNENEICGYSKEFFLNAGEGALRIVLHYKKQYRPTYERHSEIVSDIVSMIENYLPIVDKTFVSSDSTKCRDEINESFDEVEKNINSIRDILSMVSWDGLCEIWVDYNKNDGEYEIRSKSTNRNFEFDEELSFLDRTLRSMGLKVYIFAPWFVENCDDEVEFLK